MSEKKEKSKLSLSAKAKKFDVPLGTLKKVFRRGVAAWNSGHRPGTTPQQWGHARVNSYLRKGKTYHTADKDLHEEALIKGTNCKNCIWWKEDTEQKVDKSELNENGGLKAPNEQYIKMSKHVDMVSLPGKATVSVKAFCDHDDVKNFVTERMCCAYWNGEGTKREFKGEADVLSEEELNELKKETLQSYLEKRRAPKISDIARAETVGKPEERQKDIDRANLTRIGRARAKRKLLQIHRAENPQELVQQHQDLHHPYASRVPGVPDAPGSRYWGDHVEHEDVNKLFEKAMDDETNPFEYTGIPIPKKKDAMDPENKPGLRGIFLDATAEQQKRAAELEKKGKKGEDIWKEVGAYKDPYTGKWTREISDKEMDLPGFQPQSGLIQSDKKPKTQPAQTAIKHDQLFREVPGVKATQVTTQSVTPVEKIFGKLPYRGLYSGADVRRGYTPPSIHTLTIGKKGALDVMAHELQHNVDDLQNRFSPPKYDTATFNQSKLTNMMRHSVDPNEIRANAAMSRRELDDKQRQERYPLKDYKLGASIFGGKVGIPLTWVPQSLREMQLVGTDEYRQHAIAMTPGQDQEIEDAFPPEVYGTEVYEPTTQEESANAESDGSVESGVDSTSGNSFRTIRKKLQEQEVEELEDEEQIEGEEEQTEDDGAEDGVDFTPNLKTTKARKYVPQVSAADSVSGFPVLGIAEGLFDKLKAVKSPTSPPRPPVSRTSNILRNVSRNAGRISTGAAVVGAGAKAAAGDYSGAATDAAVQAGQSAAAKLATKKAATMTAKFVSKAAARKLPLGLGLAATGAGVADRLRSRDYLGAAGEGLSGLAGTLPGVGTAVSAGIDTALLGRDLKNLQAQTQQKKKPTLAEAVDYHQENNISLIENAFRPGSEMFFAMILEAKRQYAEGEYTPQDEFEQDLLESNIGEVAEYNGETVLLDFPYEDEELNEEGDPTHGKGIGKPFRSRGGGAVYVKNEKGNVIKVNFSQSGMRKRFNEPARVRSFVARHNCYGNKDRTSASYWACRWPRYFSDSGQQWW